MRILVYLVFVMLLTAVVSAQSARLSVTHDTLALHEGNIAYQATVREYLLPSADSPVCSAIFTSYERTGVSGDRPIVFFFNGGPGASSSPLHLYAFGPARLRRAADTLRLVNNEYSLLSVADLVFIDPPGTGYTRIFRDASANQYFDVATDAASIADLVKQWRQDNGKTNRPFFICGESYGTIRAAKMAALLTGAPLKGVLLFSPVLDMSMLAPVSGNELPNILSVPSMAAIAWFHKKADPSAASAAIVFNHAVDWVKNQYAPSLFAGTERKLAGQLAAKLGLPISFVSEKNARIRSEDFEVLLLAENNLRIGKLNGQVAKPYNRHKQTYSSREDPSLVVNTDVRKDVVGRYFINRLQFPAEGLYKGINFEVNGRWQWQSMDAYRGYYSVLPDLEQAMQQQGKLRLLVAGGYYDLATPLFAAKYLLDHSTVPKNRTTFLAFPTGHSIFEEEKQLAGFAAEIRSFVNAALRQ